MAKREFRFLVGSQCLYGEDVLKTVDSRAAEMAELLTRHLPYPLLYKGTVKSSTEIDEMIHEANYDKTCAGIVTWCHTFSPSKMWIGGLSALQKRLGDCKTAAMTAILKAIGEGENGASAFMEDFTYHLAEEKPVSLGAHMLEVYPSLAANKPRIETHHLGIDINEKDPARFVFEGKAGPAIVVSLVDMGGRMRLICQDIECVKPILTMPNLPVARVMWKPMPDLLTGIECWITAGGAHHTVLSYDITAEQMKDFVNMMGIEFVHITKDTTVESLEEKLLVADLIWKLK